jgi:hypothetical protein
VKLADAETLLKVIKLDGPIKEHWEVLTDEGILLEAEPMGVAHGAFSSYWGIVTARARTLLYGPQYHGVGIPGNFSQARASRFRAQL